MAELLPQPRLVRARDAGPSTKGSRGPRRKGEGQQATEAGLDLLRVLGWLVLHDVTVPAGPASTDAEVAIDHVLVGPSGVYVVNTVAWSGQITAKEGVLVVGKADHSDVLVESAAGADAVRTLLGGTPVAPLVCFERLEAVAGVAGDVALCASENILDLLTSQPEILDGAAVARASARLTAACRPGSSTPPPVVAQVAPAPPVARRPVTGPSVEELARARTEQLAAQARAGSPEQAPPTPDAAAPAATHPDSERHGLARAFRRSRRSAAAVEPAPVAVQPVVSAEPVAIVESAGVAEVEPAPSPSTARLPHAAVAEAGAALWLSLTDDTHDHEAAEADSVRVEPVLGVVDDLDVEAALVEAAARQREAEQREAQEREARESASAEAQVADAPVVDEELEAHLRAEREAHQARALAAREAFEQAQREAVEAEAREQAEREERERLEAEAREQAEREERERLEAEAREQAEREEQARLEAEAREQAEREEQARLEAEAREQAEREEQARLEAEAREQAEREEQARLEAEAREQAEREERERLEAEAREQAEREEQARLEAEAREQAEREAREQARLEAEAREQAEREAREQAEREEQARLEAEAREQAEREEQARLEAEAREQAEREEQARLEAEAREQAEREAREQAEREEQARLEAEAREQAEREEQARLEAEAREQAEREEREQAEREERERLEAEAREQAEREERERLEAEAREQAEREEQARLEAEAREQAEREEQARLEAEAREQAEREAREQAEREERERLEAEAREQAEREEQARLEAEAREQAEEAAARAAWEARLQAAREARGREAHEAAARDADEADRMAVIRAHQPDVRQAELLLPETDVSPDVAEPADEVDLDTWEPAQDAHWEPEVVEDDEPEWQSTTTVSTVQEAEEPDEVAPLPATRGGRVADGDIVEPTLDVPGDERSKSRATIWARRRKRRTAEEAEDGRARGHGFPGRAMVHVALGALLIAGVIVGAPRAHDLVAWAQHLVTGTTSTTTVGTLVKVAADTQHPAVEVLAGTPVDVPAAAGAAAGKGKHLVVVPFLLHNEGTAPWQVPVAAQATVVDELGVRHPVAKGVKAVMTYPLLPGRAKVAPGQQLKGYAVFALPDGRTVASVSLGLSQVGGEPVTWRVSP